MAAARTQIAQHLCIEMGEQEDATALVRLRRFLRTGLEGGRYQAGGAAAAGATKFSSESAPTVHALLQEGRGLEVVKELVKLSESPAGGRPSLVCLEALAYTLALCAASDHRPTKKAAYAAFPQVCGCPVQLFAVTRYLEAVSEGTGWGRAHRRAVAHWYTEEAVAGGGARQLAARATRVVRRHRWTHADLLRLAHVRPPQHRPGVALVLCYLSRGLPAATKMLEALEEKEGEEGKPSLDRAEAEEVMAYLRAVHEVRHTQDEQVAARLLEEHQLALQHVPSHLLRSKEVWLGLLRRLPLDQLAEHIPRLARGGMLHRSPLVGALVERLRAAAECSPPPLGPLDTYALSKSLESGHQKQQQGGASGGKHHHHHQHRSAQQLAEVLAALHQHSFKAVSPSGKRYLVAVDVRGPMAHGRALGLGGAVTPAEASALVLQALLKTGDPVTAVAFSARGLTTLAVDAETSLADISRRMRETPMGPVDVSLPLRWAKEEGRPYDVVLVCTDNQTQGWASHPAQALKEYREACKLPQARFVVCAMCSRGFSLAAPDEMGMLDIAGCDGNTLQLIQDFARGDF